MSEQLPYIVADIGGTNARFGLVTGFEPTTHRFKIENKQKYPSDSFKGIEQATEAFMNSIGNQPVSGACLAVAGPITNDQVNLTNLNWKFSIAKIRKQLYLDKLEVINDFAAYAFATQYIHEEHLKTLNEGQVVKKCPIAIVGPGTGFGVAALLPQGKSWSVLATEGGHIGLAAKTQLQSSVIAVLAEKFSHISVERVFSGPGLRNLYLALAQVEGLSVQPMRSSEITKNALLDCKSLEYRTLSLFCSWLGQTCGNLALTLGARGGVYLGGGVLLKFIDFLTESDFMQNFLDNELMHDYLKKMPVQLITEGNSALLGAAAWYQK